MTSQERLTLPPVPPVFLYRGEVEQELGEARRSFRLFFAGRGIGKTSLVSAIVERFVVSERSRANAPHLLVDGSLGPASALGNSQVGSIADRGGLILIDDLHQLLSRSEKEEGGPTRVFEWLDDLQSTIIESGRGGRIIATSATRFDLPRVFESRGQSWKEAVTSDTGSRVLMRFHATSLDPWAPGWSDRFHQEFLESFSGKLDGAWVHDWARAWGEQILKVSGGHPAVFGPMCADLLRAATQYAVQPQATGLIMERPGSSPSAAWRDGAVQYLVGSLSKPESGIRRLERLLTRLRESRSTFDHESLHLLKTIARGEPVSSAPESPRLHRLADDGLVRYDPAERSYVVPGCALTRAVLSSLHASLETRPDPGKHPTSGVLVFRSGNQEEEMRVAGSPWSVLSELVRLEGRYTTRSALAEGCGISERAVDAAILRIRNALKDSRAPYRVENARGQGYRLVVEAGT
jgi:hypothetical protein